MINSKTLLTGQRNWWSYFEVQIVLSLCKSLQTIKVYETLKKNWKKTCAFCEWKIFSIEILQSEKRKTRTIFVCAQFDFLPKFGTVFFEQISLKHDDERFYGSDGTTAPCAIGHIRFENVATAIVAWKCWHGNAIIEYDECQWWWSQCRRYFEQHKLPSIQLWTVCSSGRTISDIQQSRLFVETWTGLFFDGWTNSKCSQYTTRSSSVSGRSPCPCNARQSVQLVSSTSNANGHWQRSG